ncbi:MAG: glycerol-3-phosphate 1-O-acyltransferase PlsY [Desulfobulbaceae bacterium]|nr:glycerol-3-phosphate 1-O-acyltransferase PlsY [Desulfobulbaceae bacterium]
MNYLIIFISYLVGSIPFGLVLGKLSGVDIRKGGSGNIGATNVSRLVGKKIGAATLLLDAGKGLVPMVVASSLGFSANIVMFCGAAAFLGHLFPVYLKFKGGKGVATALGVFLYLSPFALLLSIGVFAAAVALSGYVSVGSLLSAAFMPMVIWTQQGSGSCLYLALFISFLIWIKHWSNIIRLVKHEEKSWKKKND